MDSEVRAEIAVPEASEREHGRVPRPEPSAVKAPLSEERMQQLTWELEPLARRIARQWATEHALHQAEELLERYQPLVHKVAIKWSRLWPSQRKDIAQEVSLTLWQVFQRWPDAPTNYLMAVANKAASKYLSRGSSIDRPLRLKRRRRWEMVSLELLSADDDGEEFVPEDKVRRHQHADRWTSIVEDVVIARLLYLDIHGHLSKMERRVLQARVLGYRNGEIAALLGLTYQQVKRARHQVAAKARRLWDGHMELPAAAARARK
jgi:RNA polymerase sigma factor (sigma-70 family)